MSGKHCFLVTETKKYFTENKRLRMLNLRNAARATLESSQHCFLGAQTGKDAAKTKRYLFIGTQNFSATNVSYARKRGNI